MKTPANSSSAFYLGTVGAQTKKGQRILGLPWETYTFPEYVFNQRSLSEGDAVLCPTDRFIKRDQSTRRLTLCIHQEDFPVYCSQL
ncbi:MAG: hypothetical protein WCT32_02800 [Patescibacteria group bacterium]|jgi:hypothetical protein